MVVAELPAPEKPVLHRGFPRISTSFSGRVDDVHAVNELLAHHHLVTIVGPGGIGKTRLAVEISKLRRDQSGERVWLVELAPVDDAALVASAVAGSVGSRQMTGKSTTHSVAGLLSSEPTLLVLDNCEHVGPAVAALCADLLSLVDDLRILATSREPLVVPGEARWRLRPLEGRVSPGSGPQAPGVELFIDRVHLVDPAFELTKGTLPMAAQIVRKVEGLPLAIELAAARGELLGIEQLSIMLDEPLDILTGGPAAAQERHRSLRATGDWSCQLPDRRHFAVSQSSLRRSRSTPQRRSPEATPLKGSSTWLIARCSLHPRSGPTATPVT